MGDYLNVNREAYELTAQEFGEKTPLREKATRSALAPLLQMLGERSLGCRILELGPGSGYAAKLLLDLGYRVTALDFSPKMAAVAKQTAPRLDIVVDEFLAHDFGAERFPAVVALAFVHLFTGEDSKRVIRKIHNLLEPAGLVCMSSTRLDVSGEGYDRKTNFRGAPQRYRKRYTREELESVLRDTGFTIRATQDSYDSEVPGKCWMEFLLEKSDAQ